MSYGLGRSSTGALVVAACNFTRLQGAQACTVILVMSAPEASLDMITTDRTLDSDPLRSGDSE
jgi:hypothetical protein